MKTIHSPADHVRGYSEAIGACKTDDAFHAWFNSASGAHHAMVNGAWDFAVHIAHPIVRQLLKNPQDKTALEIGCGGGRMLAAAGSYFKSVIGLDIHDDLDRTQKALPANASVIRGDGETIPLADGSVDFVYSFIVLHHLQSFAAFRSYLAESRRVLRPGGLAMLYYGKRPDGIQEATSYNANERSLSMSAQEAVRAASQAGFEVIEQGESWRFGEAELRRGHQGYLLLR